MQVILKSNIKEFTKKLTRIQKQQVPFATSRALNDTAINAQDAIVKGIQIRFVNRKKWWLKRQPTGVKVAFSNKRKLWAVVFTNAKFAGLQEEGGIKTPKGRAIAIPAEKLPKRLHKAGGARKLLQSNKKAFSSPKGIFRRRGKKRLPIIQQFSYAKTATVRPRLKFVLTATVATNRKFERNFYKRLSEAIKTAK